MKPTAPLRFPLQLGTNCVWSLARAAACGPPGLLLMLAVLQTGGVILAIPGLALLAYATSQLYLAWSVRASDLVLGPEGLSIIGGPLNGKCWAWSEFRPPLTRVAPMEHQRLTLATIAWPLVFRMSGQLTEKVRVFELRLVLPELEEVTLAQSERPIERDSFQALCVSIRAAGEEGGALPSAVAPGLVLCRDCGAAVTPDDAADVPCAHCGARTQMPAALRVRIGAARAVGSAIEAARASRGLLAQRSASATNRMLLLAAFALGGAWLLAVLLSQAVVLEATHWAVVAMSASGLVLAVSLLARARLVRRSALLMVMTNFGARVRDGVACCRACGAPLPPPRDGALSRCAYCETDNIVGVDLRPFVAIAERQERSLSKALERRRYEERLWAWASLAALGLFAVSVWYARHV